jgi:hypothetical protein
VGGGKLWKASKNKKYYEIDAYTLLIKYRKATKIKLIHEYDVHNPLTKL